MRTTVAIDDNLLGAAKERARERGQTLGQVIEDALRRDIAAQSEREAIPLPVFDGGGGLLPGVEVRSNRALAELLDRDVPLDRLR